MDCSHVTKIPTGDATWREEACGAPAFGLFLGEPFCWHHLHAIHAERMRPIEIRPLPPEAELGRTGLRHWGGPVYEEFGKDPETIGATDAR